MNKKKIVLVIICMLLLFLTILASVGLSSLTHDYNYFLFTTLGITIILICLYIYSLYRLIKNKVKFHRRG